MSLFTVTSMLAVSAGATPMANDTQFLQLSAVVTKNNNSVIECWQLSDAFVTSAGAGTVGALSLNIENLANATYTVLPPFFEGGVHNSPHPQYVFIISFHDLPLHACHCHHFADIVG
jgi:hypothetical protein